MTWQLVLWCDSCASDECKWTIMFVGRAETVLLTEGLTPAPALPGKEAVRVPLCMMYV